MSEDFHKYLNTLCGDSLVTFQTYDDDKSRKSRELSRIIHGATDEHVAKLKALNEQGAGISVMVNEGDGKGRSEGNVLSARAVFLDLDGSPLEPVLATGLTPHMVVESSADRWHVYWKTTGCTLDQFTDLQKRIAKRFNGDDKIYDRPRVMRMAGTYHNKKEPFLCRITEIHNDLPCYTVEEIVIGLGLPEWEEEQKEAKTPTTPPKINRTATITKVEKALSHIDPRPLEYDVWCKVAFAMHNEFGGDGYGVFNEWSKRDPERHSDTSTDKFWKGIKGTTTTPVTVGFIYRLAAESGWSVTPPFVEEFNVDHFIAFDAGSTLVIKETVDPETDDKMLRRYSFMDFKNMHCNQFVEVGFDDRGNPKVVAKGKAWIDHPDRRQYEGLVMSPEKDYKGYYNLWRGFSVEPTVGSWQKMKDHIRKIICSNDPKLFAYVIGWLASMVQFPARAGQVALVLKGGRGTGKGMFGNWLCKLLGSHSRHVTQGKHVTGEFNVHLRDCVFLFADEAFFAGDKQAENVLKSLITEPDMSIVAKGKDLFSARNMLHIMMASNNDWVVPAGADERRYCVLEVSGERQQDIQYFHGIEEEMKSGGLSAMLFDLLEYDLSSFQVRTVPQTSALLEQKLQSLDPFMSWWLSRLQEGTALADLKEYWGPTPSQLMYDDYIKSVAKIGVNWKCSDTQFGINFKKVLPAKDCVKKQIKCTIDVRDEYMRGKKVNHYMLPDLKKCRKLFENYFGHSIEWDVANDDRSESAVTDFLFSDDQDDAA